MPLLEEMSVVFNAYIVTVFHYAYIWALSKRREQLTFFFHSTSFSKFKLYNCSQLYISDTFSFWGYITISSIDISNLFCIGNMWWNTCDDGDWLIIFLILFGYNTCILWKTWKVNNTIPLKLFFIGSSLDSCDKLLVYSLVWMCTCIYYVLYALWKKKRYLIPLNNKNFFFRKPHVFPK